ATVSETPPFDEALSQFLRFIQAEGFNTELAWAFREDVTNCRRTYWVRIPTPAGNLELMRRYYEHGRRAGLGVTLAVLCRVGSHSVCYAWAPEDEQAASYAMQGPLKFQVPSPPMDASPVRSGIAWFGLRLLNRWRHCVTFSASLPSRKAVTA
ncbi:hypothetical protein AB1L88_26765, partial [Tautonia sp. JC769]|uniref:hypothetical protein n=1 Tax=Tautonia sp. JC769 TaxID=3232135 RepID=UPI0034598E8C